jgi:pimeloyl-ACP methyl ester carboxylesterase
MKPWPAVLAAIGAVLIACSAWALLRWSLPERHILLNEDGCHTPVTVLDPPGNQNPFASVVLFHGLAANSRLMTYLGTVFAHAGWRVYLPDLPGHGKNTDRFTFARAQQCADSTVEFLERSGQIDPKKTILAGHSLGGAIAIRMADRAPALATIAISPAPMIAPRRMPSNLLVVSAGFDIPALKREALALKQAAGGERTSVDDFSQERAFHLEVTRFDTHTSLIQSARIAEECATWIHNSLYPQDRMILGLSSWDANVRTFSIAQLRQDVRVPATLGLIGSFLLFPLGATIAASICKSARPYRAESFGVHINHALVLAEGAACAIAAALLLELGTPLKFLHLYSGDYLASLLLIVAALLLAVNLSSARKALSFKPRGLVTCALLGFATILVVGGWLSWRTTTGLLNAPRWLRFAELLPIAWLFCYAEEVVLGPLDRGKRRAMRFALSMALRAELWLACALMYYMFASGQVLIMLLFVFLAAFSILHRLAADALLRRDCAPPETSLFSAILAAWFIAAVFPLT